jgi:hypothetical protein
MDIPDTKGFSLLHLSMCEPAVSCHHYVTPARDFLLETPWRIIISKYKCKQSFPLILITKKGVNLSSCVFAKLKSAIIYDHLFVWEIAISYQTRTSIWSSLVLGVLRQACCKHHGKPRVISQSVLHLPIHVYMYASEKHNSLFLLHRAGIHYVNS